MPKLHIVGITDDHRGLILSERSRAKTGDLLLEINDDLMAAISEARRARMAGQTSALQSAALPTRHEMMVPGDPRNQSKLSPREIQRRLRMGESVGAVARRAGMSEEWVERFAAPVIAEQARIVDQARGLHFTKARLGESSAPLGESVLANVFDKGVRLTMSESEDGWSAFQRRDDLWCISFTYASRGKKHVAEWDFYPETKELLSRNRLGSELAFIDARQRRRKRPGPEPEVEEETTTRKRPTTTRRPTAKKASGARTKAAATRKPAKKVAKKKATTARKPVKKKATTARKPVKKTTARKKATTARTPVKKTTARKKATTARKPVKKTTKRARPLKARRR